MSRDIVVQDIPDGVEHVDEIPEGWTPQALPFDRPDVIATVRQLVPDADVSDPGWVPVSLPGVEIEVSCSDESPLPAFALHVRAADPSAADSFIRELLHRLNVRAFDPESESGIFDR